MHHTQCREDLSVLRGEGECLFQRAARFGEAILLSQNDSQVQIALAVFRIVLDGLPEERFGFLDLSLAVVDYAQIALRLGELRIDSESGLKVPLGIGETVLAEVQHG